MDMDFYRGDDRSPNDEKIRKVGFDGYPEYKAIESPDKARAWITEQLKKDKNVMTMAFRLRVQTPGGLIATAMKEAGAFEGKRYVYKITIPNVSLVELKNSGAGAPINGVEDPLEIRKYFLVLDNPDYNQASLIGIGHGQVDTKEATFLTPIPAKYIVGHKTKTENQFQPMPA
jgi:hypothetical protein